MTTSFALLPFPQQMRAFEAAKANYRPQSDQDSLPTTQQGNTITTRTPGGYTIVQQAGSEGKASITAPDGSAVEIWGDPHLGTRSNAGAATDEKFKFLNDSSLVLQDGTKITTHTVPGPNNQTLLGGTTITNGRSSASTSGLSAGEASLSRMGEGRLLDALTNDGMRINVGAHAQLTGADGQTADQSYVNANDTGNLMGHLSEMTDFVSSGTPFDW